MTLTTVQDLAKVVAAAIDYEGEWPEVGGIRGGQITISKLLELGGEIRGKPISEYCLEVCSQLILTRFVAGKPFTVDRVTVEDLESGNLKTSWVPAFSHPNVPEDQHEAYAKVVIIGALIAAERGAYDVSDEWNKLLPHLRLTSIESFLRSVWEDRP